MAREECGSKQNNHWKQFSELCAEVLLCEGGNS